MAIIQFKKLFTYIQVLWNHQILTFRFVKACFWNRLPPALNTQPEKSIIYTQSPGVLENSMLLKALASNTTCFILCICALNHSSTFGFPEVPPLFRNLTIEYLVFFPVTVSWENFEPQTSFFLEFGVCQLLSRTSRGIYRELGYFLARVSTASWTFRF